MILASGGGGGSGLLSIGILLLIPFAMYFFMIRPQRKRVKDQQSFQRSIGVGDDVVTTSGIHGKITGEFDDETFWLEIDDDVQIRIARAAIQGHAADPAEDDDAEDDADDDAEDDADQTDGDAGNSDAGNGDAGSGSDAELDAASDGDDA
ncbi:MAG: preprotein translocase subunit YajC [Acidimicrobiia bacterium]|nr:preprotein translocase subunit YajC [Acidimicrobiia bacterium]